MGGRRAQGRNCLLLSPVRRMALARRPICSPFNGAIKRPRQRLPQASVARAQARCCVTSSANGGTRGAARGRAGASRDVTIPMSSVISVGRAAQISTNLLLLELCYRNVTKYPTGPDRHVAVRGASDAAEHPAPDYARDDNLLSLSLRCSLDQLINARRAPVAGTLHISSASNT